VGVEYIGQGPYADCTIVAMCNALRFHGQPSPSHPSDEWERLVDIGGGRYGPVIDPKEVAEHLGLVMQKTGWKNKLLPLLLSVWNPEIGSALHSVLVIGWEGQRATVVNYRTETGPLIETLEWSTEDAPPRSERWPKLYMPKVGNVNRRWHWLTLKGVA